MGRKGAKTMEFWKEHAKLRMVLIAILFVAGVVAVIAALCIYNIPFERPHKKKS